MKSNLEIAKKIRETIREGDISSFNELINLDESLLTMMTPFGTWLHVAVSFGNLSIVKRVVDLGVDVNIRGGTFDGNALNFAASQGHVDIVKYLLSCGSEIDVSDPVRNPLFSAIYCGDKEIVNVLVEAGTDVNVKYSGESMNNMGALEFAIEGGQTEIAELLRETSESNQLDSK